MELYRTDFGGTKGPYTVEEAVTHETERAAMQADGTVERLRSQVECLQGMVARLIDAVPYSSHSERQHVEKVGNIVGYCWGSKD